MSENVASSASADQLCISDDTIPAVHPFQENTADFETYVDMDSGRFVGKQWDDHAMLRAIGDTACSWLRVLV